MNFKHPRTTTVSTASDSTPEQFPLDPLVVPLMTQLIEISRQLAEFRKLVEVNIAQIEDLYRKATLVGRKKAARLLAISESQFDRHLAAGKLVDIHINRRKRVSLTDLEMFIAARAVARRHAASIHDDSKPKKGITKPSGVADRAKSSKRKKRKAQK